LLAAKKIGLAYLSELQHLDFQVLTKIEFGFLMITQIAKGGMASMGVY
jgi:hypothetical protein